MSVRAVEAQVRQRRNADTRTKTEATGADTKESTHLRHLEGELQRLLGTAVRIQTGKGQTGKIEIPFYGHEDFERVMELLLGAEAER